MRARVAMVVCGGRCIASEELLHKVTEQRKKMASTVEELMAKPHFFSWT